MKLILFLSLLGLSSFAQAYFPAPDAAYTGSGQLTQLSDGTHFSYNVSYVLNGNSVTASYTYPNGYSYSLYFTTSPGQNGLFTVQIQGQMTGSGYCIGNSCHVDTSYSYNGATEQVSMALIYTPDSQTNLVVSGHNATSNTIWEDRLASGSQSR